MKHTKKISKLGAILCGLPIFVANTGQATVALPAIFSDHMVLQRAEKTPVWGTAAPGEKVHVQLGSISADSQAGGDGRWQVSLDLSKADTTPLAMEVEGANHIRFEDVLVGEVWLCAGQSNMEFSLDRAIGAPAEIARPNPKLRQFLVQRNSPLQPADQCGGQWQTVDAATAKGFTAVGYFFGAKLQETLQVPVGLIKAAVGSTPIEAWTSRESLAKDPDLKASTEANLQLTQDFPQLKKAYVEAYSAWERSSHREDRPTGGLAAFLQPSESAGWKKITLPATFSADGLPDAGAVWLAKKIDVPAAKAGQPFAVGLGPPAGWETVYWNGVKVGGRTFHDYRGEGEWRTYNVPAAQVKAGANILCVRLFNAVGGLGMPGKPLLGGDNWLAKPEFALPPLSDMERGATPRTFNAPPDPKQLATALFNGMIHPLIPYAVAGVIWYQGENNAERAYQYRKAFPLLIQDWRTRWGREDLPFLFCQLANYHAKANTPGESDWAELREAQTMTLTVPNTGEAILIDIGEAGDIHPRNKKTAGERLAALALAKTYGRKVPFAGPAYQSMTVDGSRIRLQFGSVGDGLVAAPVPTTFVLSSQANENRPLTRNSPGSELEGFAICGADRRWVWANARIDGGTVLVESPQVARPVAVRYGWAENPTCNLYNRAGFPAGPFRTDDFPVPTASKKY